MDISLVFVMSDGQKREVPLKHHAYTLGRATDCQIRLPESAVSRHHAEMRVTDSGASIKDLGSSNGTYVNKQRLTSEVELAAGDLVAVGSTVFVVKVDGEPGDVDGDYAREFGMPDDEPAPMNAAPAAAPTAPAAAAPAPSEPAPSELDPDDSDAGGGLLDDLGISSDDDGSSFGDFEFDLGDDDDDDQPAL